MAWKTGEVIIEGEHPWDLGGYTSVLKDGETYHLWYTSGSNLQQSAIAYARSGDGIHWEHPLFTLTSEGSAKPNNVVLGLGAGGIRGGVHGCMVFLAVPPGGEP